MAARKPVIHTSTRSGWSRRGRGLATSALASLLVLGVPGTASAATSPQDLSTEWGRATVSASPYFIGGVAIEATVADTKADSRCVYVDYKINASRWFDGFDKLTRVCGRGHQDGNSISWVGPSWSSAHSIEFRLCREQGLGRDSCSPIVTIDI